MNRDDDIGIIIALAWVGIAATAPLWGPVALVSWLFDKVRGR